MEEIEVKNTLKEFHGTSEYHKHLYPGRPAILKLSHAAFSLLLF
jgi:hypothetical protein